MNESLVDFLKIVSLASTVKYITNNFKSAAVQVLIFTYNFAVINIKYCGIF